MLRKLLAPALALFASLPAAASDSERFEIAGWGGWTVPFWSQTFVYDPGPVSIPVPGLSVDQQGEFTLKAKGGLAVGGGFSFYPVRAFGIEGRLDSVAVSVDTDSAKYSIDAKLPPPLPPYSTTIDLSSVGGASTRANVPSINLVLRTTGATRLRVSGGLSYMPSLEVAVNQTLGLGVSGVTSGGEELKVATLGFSAVAPAETVDKIGYNIGVGLGFSIGDRVDLLAEIRYFDFPT